MLRVDTLSKTYPPASGVLKLMMRTASTEPVEALSGVTFEASRGKVVGLVGTNGAGKTTLFRIIATLLEPTSGSVTIDGFSVTDRPAEITKRIGLVLEGGRGTYGRLSGLDNLEFFGVMQGMTTQAARTRGAELMSSLGIEDPDRRVFGYSAGMRVRLALARSMLANPDLLLLDEPTRSLDPMVSLDAMELIADTARQGRAVLLATHRLDEIREFCDEVVVITRGRVRYVGPPAGQDLVQLMSETELA